MARRAARLRSAPGKIPIHFRVIRGGWGLRAANSPAKSILARAQRPMAVDLPVVVVQVQKADVLLQGGPFAGVALCVHRVVARVQAKAQSAPEPVHQPGGEAQIRLEHVFHQQRKAQGLGAWFSSFSIWDE